MEPVGVAMIKPWPVFGDLGAQIGQVDVAVLVTGHDDHAHPGHHGTDGPY